ncbi:MAG TPA: response regulator [Elusimicrobiota bacterium]|nr:response regulator [Elusimicrobiota bacterium]
MPQAEPRKPTILIADDDRSAQEILENLLVNRGYKVICARDGREALSLVSADTIDLCVLDIDMPHMSGIDLCQHIKNDKKTQFIPVIMVTGLAPEQEKIRALETGCDDFITKPVQAAELLARLKSLLHLKAMTDALEDAESILFTLARTIEAKDRYTLGHADRVARFAVSLGRELGYPEEKLELLHKGGILHDIGKLGVPDAILQKEAALDKEEWETMRKHPVMGFEICQRLKGIKEIIPIIRNHHERLDGTGYPDGLKAANIMDTVRIVSIVDIYDALTTRRSYKVAFSQEKAFQMMKEEVERGWWDKTILKVWEGMIKKKKVE